MTKETLSDADAFDAMSKLPRDDAQGWFKYDTIGAVIAGTVVDMFEKAQDGQFPAQRVFTLKRANGELWNVPLKKKDYFMSRTDMLQVGDVLAVKYEKDIPNSVKGYNPSKSISVKTTLNGPRIPGANAGSLTEIAPLPVSAHDVADEVGGDEPF